MFVLIGYIIYNNIGDFEDRNLVMGYCFFIHRAIISLYSKNLRTVLTCITEAEYIALGNTAQESVWICKFFNEQKVANPIAAYKLYDNNKTSIILTKMPKAKRKSSTSICNIITFESFLKIKMW